MFEKIKSRWEKFKKSEPGRRFQDRYHRHAHKRGERSGFRKIIIILSGIFLILAGVIMWFIPGPGWATIFVGAAFIAGESITLARFLDYLELKIRKYAKKNKLLPDE